MYPKFDIRHFHAGNTYCIIRLLSF